MLSAEADLERSKKGLEKGHLFTHGLIAGPSKKGYDLFSLEYLQKEVVDYQGEVSMCLRRRRNGRTNRYEKAFEA